MSSTNDQNISTTIPMGHANILFIQEITTATQDYSKARCGIPRTKTKVPRTWISVCVHCASKKERTKTKTIVIQEYDTRASTRMTTSLMKIAQSILTSLIFTMAVGIVDDMRPIQASSLKFFCVFKRPTPGPAHQVKKSSFELLLDDVGVRSPDRWNLSRTKSARS